MNLQEIAATTFKNCMGLKSSEVVLVVTDTPLYNLGKYFFEAAVSLGAEVQHINFLPRNNNGEEPPVTVAEAMKAADVVLLITSKSLSHTQARKKANVSGTRVASMPGLTEEMMRRTLAINYLEIQEQCSYLEKILTQGQSVGLTTEQGTDITFSIKGRTGQIDGGIYTEPGAFGNLPAGEVYIAPVEGTAEGKIVIDGSMAAVGMLDKPLVIQVKRGLALDAKGPSADIINNIFYKYGEKSRNVAELGIGVHPKAKLSGFILEDEKIKGTVHLALGDNSNFGGEVQVASHLDGVILKPTLKVDGKAIIIAGRWL